MSDEITDGIRKPNQSNWVIVTLKEPLLWARSNYDDETWMLNPPRRYILNANQLNKIGKYVSTISDLKNSSYYRPIGQNTNLKNAKILVERHRDRGVGDLLFLTGPLEYIQHISGKSSLIDIYTLTGRGSVLDFHPAIRFKSPLVGPIHYDDLPLYDYHWFIDTVTEYDEEQDQLNVYDALYKQLGLDPKDVPFEFKRPSIAVVDSDMRQLDNLFYAIWNERQLDLRKLPYYVAAPLTNSTLRSMTFSQWLDIIREMSTRCPVVVVGEIFPGKMIEMDMPFESFYEQVQMLARSSKNVINVMGITPVRLLVSLIKRASAVVCMDSGPLYIAQALRTPAVSIWGTHNPGVRIGYDKDYMDTAVWNHEACKWCPCFAYSNFVDGKCPQGTKQMPCVVLGTVGPKQIMEHLDRVGTRRSDAVVYSTAKPL